MARKTSGQLKEERAEKLQAMQDMANKIKEENRNFTEEEQTKWDALQEEVDEFDTQIRQQEQIEAIERRAAGEAYREQTSEKEKREIKKFSFMKAIRGQMNGNLDGLEAEMHQEAEREARTSGMNIQGVGVPYMVLNNEAEESRALNATGESEDGKVTIETSLGSYIEALRARLITQSMGARVLTGLSGNFDLPKSTAVSKSEWAGENTDVVESNPKFGSISMTPKRLGTFVTLSKQLITQSSLDVERMVREDLAMAQAIALDKAAITGTGSNNQPKGILSTSGIKEVAGGTNGAAPTWSHIVGLETAIATENADMGNLGYLTNPQVRGKLKTTERVANSGQFIWGDNSSPINGYRARVTTQVPSDLTKGTGTALSALLFGNWNDLVIAQWGGLDLVVDPYTLAKKGQIQIVIASFHDIAVRHAQSFAVLKDAKTA
ncbi:phage major capsid protein [Xanthovirga aplysinae]|uniref:phage major capsid protein n=1 Tax=Xanthovirga aplysinae TaxID=2529853 RepID=UPI0012BD2894|nr:phage major capsid protein [Xanthovirga aplysinae]MTI32811.1 phage major capsid protein [Xanthovirga aplysinae]